MADNASCSWADSNSVEVPQNPPYIRSSLSEPELLQIAAQNGCKTFTVILAGANNPLPKTDPRVIRTELIRHLGTVELISLAHQTRHGSLIVCTADAACAAVVYSITELLGNPVRARVIWENITNRFLLKDIPAEASLVELGQEITSCNNIQILEVRRFLSKTRPSAFPPVLVTSLGTGIPQEVKIWLTVQKIRQFIDRPRQCAKCFQFTHATVKCKSTQVCSSCGSSHEGPCSSQVSCLNCTGTHCADDKSCPAWAREAEFLQFKCQNFLSIADARRLYNPSPSGARTFSDVTRSKVPDSSSHQDFLQPIQALFQGYTDIILSAVKELIAEHTEQLKEWLSAFGTPPVFTSVCTEDSLSEEGTSSSPAATTLSRPSKRKRNRKKKQTAEPVNNPTVVLPQPAENSPQRSYTPTSNTIVDTSSAQKGASNNYPVSPGFNFGGLTPTPVSPSSIPAGYQSIFNTGSFSPAVDLRLTAERFINNRPASH